MLMLFPGRREWFYDRERGRSAGATDEYERRAVSSLVQTSQRRCYSSAMQPWHNQTFGYLLKILSQSTDGDGPRIDPLKVT